MSIKKMDADMKLEVKPGQWINKEAAMPDGICGTPKQVESVANTRLYLVGEGERTTYISKSSVVFVCDTKAEADSMYALSRQQEADLRGTKLEIIESYMMRIEQMLEG